MRTALETSPTIVGDAERLRQVLWNLLSNAVKFTPPGGAVEVQLDRAGSTAQVVVRDTGVGIDAEFLPHIFERFTQADGSTTRQHAGLGLGLAIVRHLVELHGGEVSAASPGPGAGTVFTVRLPIRAVVQEAAAPPGIAAGEPAPAPRVRLDGVRAVVVDDERDDRELVAMVLARAGADVRAAGSAAEALELVREFRPAVLLADIGMPGEDGYELIRKVRRSGPGEARLPAVALTAYGRSEDRARALASGFTLHLVKPVAPADLVASVASLVGGAPVV